VINKNAEEEITAVVHERTEMIDTIEHLVIHEGNLEEFYGYDKDTIKILKIQEIESIFSQDNKTYVSYTDGRQYSIKLRLYEIEPELPDYFISINKSAIANRRQIVQFDVQFSGAVDAVFKSGYRDYVSRRCFAELKRRLNYKNFMKDFGKRGMLFAWLGPVILCIVWYLLNRNGVVPELSIPVIIQNILTILFMAFIAAGISAVYTVEKLPYAMASLIQMAVLYFDYMIVYLFNGWLPVSALPVFSLIFFVGFAVIWFIIYLSIKRATGRMNSKLKNNVE